MCVVGDGADLRQDQVPCCTNVRRLSLSQAIGNDGERQSGEWRTDTCRGAERLVPPTSQHHGTPTSGSGDRDRSGGLTRAESPRQCGRGERFARPASQCTMCPCGSSSGVELCDLLKQVRCGCLGRGDRANQVLASAVLDQIFHHATTMHMRGNSCLSHFLW